MSSKTDIWMPLYIGDYLADTRRLNTEQHGAYLLLLMEYWRNECLLDDDGELAAITGLPMDRWLQYRKSLERFFIVDSGKWAHGRVESELKSAKSRRKKASENGKLGGRPKKNKNPEKTYSFSEESHSFQNKSSSPSPSPSPSQDSPFLSEGKNYLRSVVGGEE